MAHAPEEVKTKEQLEELLLEGLASPSREITDADWEELKRRAEYRAIKKSMSRHELPRLHHD